MINEKTETWQARKFYIYFVQTIAGNSAVGMWSLSETYRRLHLANCDRLTFSNPVYCQVLVGKPDGKRPLGRPRRRWEVNIKMDLQEMGRGCGDWMESWLRIATGGGRL